MGHVAGGLDYLGLGGELVDVVEGEAGDGEEEDDREGDHREIDVEPAGDDGGAAAKPCSKAGPGGDVPSTRELVYERVAVDGGGVGEG